MRGRIHAVTALLSKVVYVPLCCAALLCTCHAESPASDSTANIVKPPSDVPSDPPASSSGPATIIVSNVEVPRQLTLAAAQEIFLKNNLAIIAARYGVDVAVGQKFIAAYTPNPTLSLAAEQFNVHHPFVHPFDDAGTVDEHIYTGRIDQVLEAPGKKKYRTQSASFQVQAAEAQVKDAIRLQLFNLKQAFYSAVLARENLHVAEENVATINETEEKLKKNVLGGNVAEADLTRFQVNKVQYESDRVNAQLSYVQSVRNLVNLMGAQGTEPSREKAAPKPAAAPGSAAAADIEITGDFVMQPLDKDLLDLQREADNRSDVLAARRNVDAAESSVRLARVSRYPDVTIGGEYQRNGPGNTVGVALSVPLPVFNNKQGEIKQAEGQLSQAEAQLKQVRLQALTDIDNAYRGYESNQRLLNIYTDETLKKAAEAYRVARTLYDKGQGSRLDVLDAQRTYNQIRVAANQARYNHLISVFQLELATGLNLSK